MLNSNPSARFHFKTFLEPVPFPLLLRLKLLADIKNGSGLTLPTLCMRGMRYYYGIRTSIHIYTHNTAPVRICTPLIVSRSLRSLANIVCTSTKLTFWTSKRPNNYGKVHTVGDKIKFPLCTDSPPTCERSCQQKSPKSRPKVASDFRRTLNVIKKVADLFLSGEKIVCARIQFRPKSRACANRTRRSCNFCY